MTDMLKTATDRAALFAIANGGEFARLGRLWYQRQAEMFALPPPHELAALRAELDEIAAARDAAFEIEFEAIRKLGGDYK